jgi:hypothetical protein
VLLDLGNKLDQLETKHTSDTESLNKLLVTATNKSEQLVVLRRPVDKGAEPKTMAPAVFKRDTNPWYTRDGKKVVADTSNAVVKRQSEKIAVSTNYYLNAIRLARWEEITSAVPGVLYYVDSIGQFAIKICGQLFHGNIGVIYNNEKDPVRVKNCRFGGKCSKQSCDYYHDPVGGDGRKETRNYVANSFLYVPAISTTRTKTRRFGSADNIDSDMPLITEDEVAHFKDQFMHDLLCGLLLCAFK